MRNAAFFAHHHEPTCAEPRCLRTNMNSDTSTAISTAEKGTAGRRAYVWRPIHFRNPRGATFVFDDEITIEPENLRMGCARKLRDVPMSEQLQLILSSLLGVLWATPPLTEIVVMSNRTILGRYVGEISFSRNLGNAAHLIREIHQVSSIAALSGDEIGYVLGQIAGIRSFRRR
jgi:hypothetical protein